MIKKYIRISNVVYIRGRRGIRVNRRNLLIRLICIEMILLGINIGCIVNSLSMDDIIGQRFGFIVLILAGGEAGVGLALLVIYYRVHGVIQIESINRLHG